MKCIIIIELTFFYVNMQSVTHQGFHKKGNVTTRSVLSDEAVSRLAGRLLHLYKYCGVRNDVGPLSSYLMKTLCHSFPYTRQRNFPIVKEIARILIKEVSYEKPVSPARDGRPLCLPGL